MTQDLLDGPDVVTAREEMCRERMPKGVHGRVLGDPGTLDRLPKRPLDRTLMKMMATDDAGSGDPATAQLPGRRTARANPGGER